MASTPTPHKKEENPGFIYIYLRQRGFLLHQHSLCLVAFLGAFSAMEQGREDARDDSDAWVEDALRTDFMAANMLMRLSGSSRTPLKWLRRLPRSRQPQPSNAITHVKELRESAQASPTTPLSLTGSSSPSASDDPTRPAERTRFDDSTTQSDNPPAYPAPATTDVRSKVRFFLFFVLFFLFLADLFAFFGLGFPFRMDEIAPEVDGNESPRDFSVRAFSCHFSSSLSRAYSLFFFIFFTKIPLVKFAFAQVGVDPVSFPRVRLFYPFWPKCR